MRYVRRRSSALATISLSVSLVFSVGAAGAATGSSHAPSAVTRVQFRIHPHATGVVAHTYTVTTTSDDTLYSGAPTHTCQDTTNHAKCSLRAAIEAVNADFDDQAGTWDVINLPAGTYVLSSSVDTTALYLSYTGNLSIDGAGPTSTVINASSFDNEILSLDESYESLSVRGVGFTGGNTEYGGAVFIGGDDGASFDDCAFTANGATDDGGAIYVNGDSLLSATDTTFTSNSAEYGGGAIDDNASGNLTLSGDTFSHNEEYYEDSGFGGGAVESVAELSIENTTFANNTAGGDGAGIEASANATVTNSTFSGNDAGYAGGGISARANLNLNDSILKGNAADLGAGVYADYQAALTGDQFTSDDSGQGSDVYDNGNVTISNSTMSKGTASEEGGAIYNETSSLTLISDTITGARALDAGDGGGGIYSEDGFDSLTNVTIANSSAPGSGGYGGGILCDDCTFSMVGGTLSHDTAVDGSGGGLFNYAGLTSFQGTTISDDSSDWGGGMLATESATVTVNDSTVSGNNSTDLWGGGISAYDGSSLTVTNSSLINNRADGDEGYGGAISIFASGRSVNGSLESDTIADNQALYGGGIYTNESAMFITSSTVTGNTLASGAPAGAGGGMYNLSSSVMSADTIWSGNSGDQCAGGEITVSGGFNLDSDNSCGLYGAGDIVSHAAKLGPLQNNGGSTFTVAPITGSLAIGTGGTSCPATDQRGVTVPSGAACDIGAVFTGNSVTSQSLSKSSIVLGHEQVETFKVTVTTKLKGVKPTGTVEILANNKSVCVVHVVDGKGTCSLSPTKLKKGSYKVTMDYLGAGAVASSVASSKTLKVT